MNNVADSNLKEPLPPAERKQRRWPVILAALVIFLAGMASGAAVTVVYAVNRLQYAIHHPEAAPARIAATLARRLDLTDEQRAQVEEIVARRQVEIAAVRRQFQPAMVEQLESVRDEVAGVLDEDQRAKWTRLFEQFKERWLPATPADGPKS
jgi:Spy/CpxP family protein refolding chaperone